MSQFAEESETAGGGVDETPSPEGAPEAEAVEPETAEAVEVPDWEIIAGERTSDLQRLQAEYVNYKKRVDRDRLQARHAGIESVVQDLMPVLDSIALAHQHGEANGALKLIADELEKVAVKHGLEAFGEVGEDFDPNLHEALLAVPMEEPVEVTKVSQVMQKGYKLGNRVIRPARVGVANPQ